MSLNITGYVQQDKLPQLIESHAGLVKRIAHHLMMRLPASVQVDDLIQSGMIGLLEAAKKFDGSKGASFETYAGIRIRGSMLDEIRRGDWTPRSVHKNSRLIAETISNLESEHGRDVTDTEVAEKLDIPINEYHHMLNEVSVGKIIGIEDLGITEDVLTSDSSNKSSNEPFEGFANQAFKKALVAAISTLPEREAMVLSLYYDDEMNLREIGEILDVSESRVSQIHSQAMHKVKAKMRTWV